MAVFPRSRTSGTTYFLTAMLHDRGTRLLLDHIEPLRAAFRCATTLNPFRIDAVVVLPDHLHLLMTLPEGDADASARLQTIQRRFVFGLAQAREPMRKGARRDADVWQRRSRELAVRDDRDFARHVAYIHHDPVKHGLVAAAREWPHSSFHRFVKDGRIAAEGDGAVPAEPATVTGNGSPASPPSVRASSPSIQHAVPRR